MENQKSLRETAMETEPPTKTRNISELQMVSTDLKVSEETFQNKEGLDVTIKVITVAGERYRVPQSVLNSLKAVLEDNPKLKTFKVKKSGDGMDTRYVLIPLS